MPTTIVKHSLAIAGHRTSVSLEAAFWEGLKGIALQKGISISALVSEVDSTRGHANLSSALRVFVLKAALGEDGMEKLSGSKGSDGAADHLSPPPAKEMKLFAQ